MDMSVATAGPARVRERPDAAAGPIAMQRATGTVRIALKRRDDATVLDRLRQAGPMRARLVHPDPGHRTGVVLVNTAGGIAGGDALEVAVEAAGGTALTVATQGAERIYRARADDPPARLSTRLALGAGAALEYLPQETILFDGAALERRLEVGMAADAVFLGIETLVLGRRAMGEAVSSCRLADTIVLRRDGRIVLRDRFMLPEALACVASRRACLGGARGIGTVLYAAPDAGARLAGVRALLADVDADVDAGASCWNGLLLVRILAPDDMRLRALTRGVLALLREGRPLPRVWQC